MENSLNEIIIEKNDAQAKVEQLSDENRILMEKLEYYKELSGSIGLTRNDSTTNSNEILRLNKTLDEYKNRLMDMEENSKSIILIKIIKFLEKLNEQQKLVEENFYQQLKNQRDKMQKEVIFSLKLFLNFYKNITKIYF